MGKILNKESMGVWGYVLKKLKLCMKKLTKEWKQPLVVSHGYRAALLK